MLNNDLRHIRLVGAFSLLTGVVLLIATVLTGIFLAYEGGGGGLGGYIHGFLAFILALIVASVSLGCGARLLQLKEFVADPEELRLNWTALFLATAIAALIFPWLYWPLIVIPVLELLALLVTRPAIIRLTT